MDEKIKSISKMANLLRRDRDIPMPMDIPFPKEPEVISIPGVFSYRDAPIKLNQGCEVWVIQRHQNNPYVLVPHKQPDRHALLTR